MKHLIIILLFCFPFLLKAQAPYDTIEVKYINDSTWRIRKTLVYPDGSDAPGGTIIAVTKGQVLNIAINSVVDISHQYSYKLLEVLNGLPFKSILNRYNEIERVLPDSSVFIKLNTIFPLEEREYNLIDLRSNAKTVLTIKFNKDDQYFYAVTPTGSVEPIYITSDMHFRVGEVFDFIKTAPNTWMSLNGYLLKFKE